MDLLKKIQAEMSSWLKETRHWFHRNPELSKQEFKTADYIESKLKEFGYQVDRSMSKTSMIAWIKNGDSNNSICIRSDMDALPLTEENDVPYKSENVGCMHACGHDGHMAMALGAAKYLSENRNFNGTIYILFQCAEEIGFGANELIENGLFEKYKIDKMFALHGMSQETIGNNTKEGALNFYSKQDAMMAAVRMFEVRFKGKGGHGSEPENTIDPIPAGLEYANSIYYIKNRIIPSASRSVLSICHISSGSATACNIIPDYCVVKGTLRTVDNAQHLYEKRLHDYAELTAKKYGLELDYLIYGIDATCNNLELNEFAKKCAIEVVGEDMVSETKQVMGGEDFGLFGRYCPIVLVFISTGDNVPIHNTKYDFRDEPVPYGVAYYVKLVESILK